MTAEDKAREVLLAYLPRSVSRRLDENDRDLIVGSMLAFADKRLDEAAKVARDFEPPYSHSIATAIEALKDQK